MIFIGIDPGGSGGVGALIDGRPWAAKFADTERDLFMQVAAVGLDLTHGAFLDLLGKNRDDVFAVIEHVHSMPKQGVASSFKFGRSYGFLRCCLIAGGVPFEEASPQTWQKSLGCLSRGDKNRTKARAQQLFPSLKITHATADALLLATYASRLYHSRNGSP